MGLGFSRSGFRSTDNSCKRRRRPSDAPKAGDATPHSTIDPCSALFRKLLRRTLTLVFFCYPFVTFDDFWHHHSRHEHHPPPPLPPSSESVTTPYAASAYEVSLDAEESCPLYAGGSPGLASLPRPSTSTVPRPRCVAMETSTRVLC